MLNYKALVIGGSNGIGLSIVKNLLDRGYEKIFIVDKIPLSKENKDERIVECQHNLINIHDFSFLQEILEEVNTLIITAGIGRLTHFEEITLKEIDITMNVNSVMPMKVIKMAYRKIKSNKEFYTMVLTSIAGLVTSPLYSLYSASKASVSKFIEAVNCELIETNIKNIITEVSPGRVENTNFSSGKTNLEYLYPLTNIMIDKMFEKEQRYIPMYESVYENVLERYYNNPSKFSTESYSHKLKRPLENKRKYKVGYLSGTFDMFHIGHLNLLKRAKQYCDYLIVGVHKDGTHKNVEVAIPLEERMEILRTNIYVDEVIVSEKEDSDVFFKHEEYDYLFVGSDYKGTERFNNYEKILKPLNVKIVYFPYTKGVSSTKLRGLKKNDL